MDCKKNYINYNVIGISIRITVKVLFVNNILSLFCETIRPTCTIGLTQTVGLTLTVGLTFTGSHSRETCFKTESKSKAAAFPPSLLGEQQNTSSKQCADTALLSTLYGPVCRGNRETTNCCFPVSPCWLWFDLPWLFGNDSEQFGVL